MDRSIKYIVELGVKINKYPYSLKDVENMISVFNEINNPGMEIMLIGKKKLSDERG